MSDALHKIQDCGQSIWTDVISRQMIGTGTLERYISNDGISGVTANPTIFEKAIVDSHDYDDDMRRLASSGMSALEVYESLALSNVANAADLLAPVYARTNGCDGFVSIEVSPELAYDTHKSIEEARRFWAQLNRPNIMIKIPATREGIPAIEQLIADGINVNITLIFSVDVYGYVMDAYLNGLRRRVDAGLTIDHVASVASFFVSRVDTLVDDLLDASPGGEPATDSLKGKVAVANAKVAYQKFEDMMASPGFATLHDKGAQIQRPLWASTGTKNPAYSDTLYVLPLVGRHTVNTMTLETIEAVRNQGQVVCDAICREREQATQALDDLQRTGISLTDVTDQLTQEGVKKFRKSLQSLLSAISARSQELVSSRG
jgi:transaldolase